MKIKDTIKTLRQYNAWRRDKNEVNQYQQPDPRVIGTAIDAAISQLSEHQALLLKIDQLKQKLKRKEEEFNRLMIEGASDDI